MPKHMIKRVISVVQLAELQAADALTIGCWLWLKMLVKLQ
jgi:hypothetical protein